MTCVPELFAPQSPLLPPRKLPQPPMLKKLSASLLQHSFSVSTLTTISVSHHQIVTMVVEPHHPIEPLRQGSTNRPQEWKTRAIRSTSALWKAPSSSTLIQSKCLPFLPSYRPSLAQFHTQ